MQNGLRGRRIIKLRYRSLNNSENVVGIRSLISAAIFFVLDDLLLYEV